MKFFSFIFFLFLTTLSAQATNKETPNDTTYIFLKDYDMYKTRKRNAIKHFYKANEALKGDHPKVLIFSTGTYHFYSDGCKTKVYLQANTNNAEAKKCAFHFENIKNLVIDGRGSRLIFHEQMQPFTFDSCQNITLKNLSIDWEEPSIAQAEVLRLNDNYIDIGLNPKETPYQLVDGKIYFVVDNKLNKWTKTLEFDRRSRAIVSGTGDIPCLGENWLDYHAEATMPGVVRLHSNFSRKPQIGNFLVIQHSPPTCAGIFISDSENISVNNLRLFHAPGSGILAQNSRNLVFEECKAIPNRIKNRYFGGGYHGLQLVNCKGIIAVNRCSFHGLIQEPVKIHNVNLRAQEAVNNNKLVDGYFNDEHLIENLTPSPTLSITNSNFKSSYASGLLILATGKVTIKNNTFESSGSAILINGNTYRSLESDTTTSVLISGNFFSYDCHTSIYKDNEAIISIFSKTNSVKANDTIFHKNIRIEKNKFNPFDYPLIYASSVDGLSFNTNTVTRSQLFTPLHNRHYNFIFDYCKNVEIVGNSFSDDLLGKNIFLRKVDASSFKIDLPSEFTIETF